MFDYTSFLVLGPFNHFLPIAIDKIKGIESLPQTQFSNPNIFAT